MTLAHPFTKVGEPNRRIEMKKVYAVAAAMMIAGTASAQLGVGIEAGANLNNLANQYRGETTSNQFMIGFHGGITTDIGISNNFSVAPALRYVLKGGLQTRNYNDNNYMVDGAMFSAAIEEENKLKFHYLELPVNLVYKTGTPDAGRFMIGAGPYVAYLLNAHNKYEWEAKWIDGGESREIEQVGSEQIPVGEDDGDFLKSTDFGAQAFVGYEWPKGPFAKIGSSVGFTNVVRDGGPDFYNKNYNFFLTLGYMFGK